MPHGRGGQKGLMFLLARMDSNFCQWSGDKWLEISCEAAEHFGLISPHLLQGEKYMLGILEIPIWLVSWVWLC